MSENIDYENKTREIDRCLNNLVRLLARLVAKEQIEKQKRLNEENNSSRKRKRR